MERTYWLLLLCLTIALTMQPGPSAAYNIIGLFPHPGYSHFKVFYPIMRELAERGHNVTVVTYIRNSDTLHENYIELLLNSSGRKTVHAASFDEFTPTRSLSVMWHEYNALHEEGQESCETFFNSGYLQDILEWHEMRPYDIVISEFFNTDCYLVLPYLLRVPVIGLSSCALMPWFYDRILLPDTPSHVQSEFIGFPGVLNFKQRLVNFIQAKGLKYLYRINTNYHDNKLIAKHLNIKVDVQKIAETSTSLIFVNQHYTLSGNRPSTPQLKEIGGVHVDQRLIFVPLPRQIDEFLNRTSENEGVLFISWGSNLRASSIDIPKLRIILKVLQEQRLRVIWKWESDEKPTQSDKILFVKWAPQLALLCHPKIKYFWGHAGLLGTTEAVYCGKPMLVMPIYGDQFLNAAAVENRNVGLTIQYNDIDEGRLSYALHKIREPRYAANAAALSTVFRDREKSPKLHCVWWIEYVMKHGKSLHNVLKPSTVKFSFFAYHSLDVLALMLAGFALFFYVSMLLVLSISWDCGIF